MTTVPRNALADDDPDSSYSEDGTLNITVRPARPAGVQQIAERSSGQSLGGSPIDLMLEAERRGILPDHKKPLLEEARRRGLVPNAGRRTVPSAAGAAPGPDNKSDTAGEHYMRLVNAYIPGSARLNAAVGAAADYFIGPEDDKRSFGKRYDDRLRREWARNDEAQKDDSIAGIAARTAGLGATTVMTGGANLLRSTLAANPTVPQLMKESARIGAGFGAPTSLANTRESDPIHQAGDVIEGAIGGGTLGLAFPLVPQAAQLVGKVAMAPVRGLRGGRVATQAQRADEMRAALGSDIKLPGAAIAESPTLQRSGQGLSGSLVGGPVRRDVEPVIDRANQQIQRTIAGRAGIPGRAEFGDDTQGFLRRNLRESSRGGNELDAMTPAELEGVRGRGGYNPAETYPTQFGARYRLAEQEPAPLHGSAENIRANFLDPAPALGRGPTAVRSLLNEIGLEARGSGRLKGWREGDFDSPEFWQVLRGHFGDEVTGILHSEAQRAGARQANLTIPGLRDQRTQVRRTIQDVTSGDPAAGTAVGDVAALQRLHGAMTDDLQRFLNAAGATNASLRYLATDRAYRDFVTRQREPLRRIFGDKVSPDEAFNRLYRATQNDTQDIRLLRAYYQTLADKGQPGDVLRATRTLLSPASEGGLQGFLDAFTNLAPEARQIMFGRGQTAQLGADLDRLARVAARLRPYEKAMAGGRNGIDLSRASNVAAVAGFFYHLPLTLQVMGGAHLLARFMASPRYVRWLTEMPTRGAGGLSSPAFRAHLTRLNTLAADDKELGKAVLEAVGEVLRPASASAAPAGPGVAPGDDEIRLKLFEDPRFRQWHENERQKDPQSQFNDYQAGRSYEGMGDPFMHYFDTLAGRQWFQRERKSLDPETLRRIENYMELRRRQFGLPAKPGS